MLEPRGPAAAEIADLWWLLFWAALAVFIVVLLLCCWAVFRSHRHQAADDDSSNDPRTWRTLPEPVAARPVFVVVAGGIIPAFILLGVLGAAVRSSNVLLDYGHFGNPILSSATSGDAENMLTIEVIGHQWWWEVRYPDYGIVTANEIHMPAGERVQFKLTSRDVIHSFWVPQLHGKIDVIDGKTYTIALEAWEPGRFRGICAEYCGVQHTFMDFLVIAQPAETFAEWIAAQQQSHPMPQDEQQAVGRAIYAEARCDQCHIVRGHDPPAPPTGRAGPDLTHLASRTTLGAGTVENTPETLAQWLLDPHEIKPGVHMPPTPLEADDLNALVAYLFAEE